MSLHAPKSIDPVRFETWSVKVHRGEIQKVTVDYSITMLLDFSKTNGRKKAGVYVNVHSSPLTPSTPI